MNEQFLLSGPVYRNAKSVICISFLEHLIQKFRMYYEKVRRIEAATQETEKARYHVPRGTCQLQIYCQQEPAQCEHSANIPRGRRGSERRASFHKLHSINFAKRGGLYFSFGVAASDQFAIIFFQRRTQLLIIVANRLIQLEWGNTDVWKYMQFAAIDTRFPIQFQVIHVN